MSDETATLSRTVYEPIAIQVLREDIPMWEQGWSYGENKSSYSKVYGSYKLPTVTKAPFLTVLGYPWISYR